LAIVGASRAVRLEGGAPSDDAAVRVMATQMAFVCRVDRDPDVYGELVRYCAGRVDRGFAQDG